MKINGLDFNVKIAGDGVPFIWGHGLTMNMAVEEVLNIFRWEEIQETAMVIRYDARGHGRSEATYSPQDYIWSNLAKDMILIADECRLDRFIAGGQSMGCATAINTALSQPARVQALVLVNPTTAWETRPAQAAQYRRSAGIADKLGPGKLASAMKRVPTGMMPAYVVNSVGERLEAVYQNLGNYAPEVLIKIYEGAALSDLPPQDHIAGLKLPALILAWEGDGIHPTASARALHALMSGSELVVAENITDVGQWPDRIKTFLSNNTHN
jgi:3-oxoadipate enol-lactonase